MPEIRDPIHGFIEVGKDEFRIIDSPVFQRLRRIKQLALAELVYPGATHTRFGHSLGVFSLASVICKRLDIDNHNSKIVKYASLLHDLGHGPFSHVSETIIRYFSDRSELSGHGAEDFHERLTSNIIEFDASLNRVISATDNEDIRKLISKNDPRRYLVDIISGPIDADKQDYFLRDTYYCGVKYGLYDIDRLLNCLTLIKDGDDSYLGIKEDGVQALDQFILAKYYLTTQIYRHRIRLITDNMIARGIQIGIDEDNLDFLKQIYTFKDDEEYICNYVGWDDERLSTAILNEGNDCGAYKIFDRLRKRDIFKVLFSKQLDDLKQEIDDDSLIVQFLTSKKPHEWPKEYWKEIEGKIASLIDVDPNYVIFYPYNLKSVKDYVTGTEQRILVDCRGSYRYYENESHLFSSIEKAFDKWKIDVYAPIRYDSIEELKDIQNKYKDPIIEIINNEAKKGEENGT